MLPFEYKKSGHIGSIYLVKIFHFNIEYFIYTSILHPYLRI